MIGLDWTGLDGMGNGYLQVLVGVGRLYAKEHLMVLIIDIIGCVQLGNPIHPSY